MKTDNNYKTYHKRIQLMLVPCLMLLLFSCDATEDWERVEDPLTREIEEGISQAYSGDEGIQNDPAVIFASGFENDFEGWSSVDTDVTSIVEDASISHSGVKSLKITATRGVDEGGEVVFKVPEGQDEIYLRFYAKIQPGTIEPNRFVGIRAYKSDDYEPVEGERPNGDEAFWVEIEPLWNWGWQFQTYWHQMRSWQTFEGVPDSVDAEPEPYTGNAFRPLYEKRFERGEWVSVEVHVKANTPGETDGQQTFWIDGVKIGDWRPGYPTGTWNAARYDVVGPKHPYAEDFEGFEYRTDGSVQISEVALNWFVSEARGIGHDAEENVVFFDNVVVSTEYIGLVTD